MLHAAQRLLARDLALGLIDHAVIEPARRQNVSSPYVANEPEKFNLEDRLGDEDTRESTTVQFAFYPVSRKCCSMRVFCRQRSSFGSVTLGLPSRSKRVAATRTALADRKGFSVSRLCLQKIGREREG